jgi:hypothetical protein
MLSTAVAETNISNKKTTTLLCIPFIESSIREEYIRNVFQSIHVTEIYKIIETPNKNNPLFKRVILHVHLNEEIPLHQYIKKRFQDKKDIKIVHHEPWYWKITEAFKGK